jgi:hypothetical protein
MLVAVVLTAVMLVYTPTLDFSRLFTFTNYSGTAGGNIWPEQSNIAWLFLLGFLLPAYTVTGFDASAHTSEETVGASHHVPRGIVRSVLVSACRLSCCRPSCWPFPTWTKVARAANRFIDRRPNLPKQLWSVLALGS